MVFSPHPEIDWRELFGRPAAVEIEIGCGKGAFLLAYAQAHPETNFLGIEIQPRWVRHIEQRLVRHPLPNVRVLRADAALVIPHFVLDESVRAYHLYFPDPWWKRRHQKRRVVQSDMVASLYRTLEPSGVLHLATDVEERFASMVREISGFPFDFEIADERDRVRWPLTNFERKYRQQERGMRYAVFTKKAPDRKPKA